MADVSVSRSVAAPAERVWELVTDLPRMGEWSPENQGGEWIGDATGPRVGAKFRGKNEHRGRSWQTIATVVEADAPRTFTFRITAMRLPIADWSFAIEPGDIARAVRSVGLDKLYRVQAGLQLLHRVFRTS